MTTTTLTYKATHKKINWSDIFSINWKVFYFLGICFFLLALVFYIFLVIELTNGAHLIKSYNKEINMLLQDNGKLQANFAEASFLGKVQERVQQMNFEKTREVRYLNISDSSLAKANIN